MSSISDSRQLGGSLSREDSMSVKDLRQSEMMAHLLDALKDGKDIGHYGRLVFAMVARHFMDEDELIRTLQRNPNFSEEEARALYLQVQGRDYNPPKRERILQWQQEQEFPICPNPDDPDACNVYKDLQFPDDVYERIGEYYEQKAAS
jgi:DNA primase large subunit